MRILPYRTLDNYISGAVITFTDISGLKHLEAQLQESTRLAESIVETVREPVLVLDNHLRVLAISRAFADTFALDPARTKGQPLHQLDGGAWHDPALRQHLMNLLTDPAADFDDLSIKGAFQGGKVRELHLYGRRISQDDTLPGRLLLGVQAVC
jgi:two-component system CheB/CheR fusion protein